MEPYLISRITDSEGNVLFAADTATQPPRVISERNAFVMDSLLRSVVDDGTGAGVRRYVRRDDVAGKTGTTNDAADGWFAGYAGNVVTVAWMGYDDNHSLAPASSAPRPRCRSGRHTWKAGWLACRLRPWTTVRRRAQRRRLDVRGVCRRQARHRLAGLPRTAAARTRAR